MSNWVGDQAATLRLALSLRQAGLAVLPINPDKKFPPTQDDENADGSAQWPHGFGWKRFQFVLPTPAKVEHFCKDYEGIWLGVACGRGSGFLEVIDFDIPGKRSLPPGIQGVSPCFEPWREILIEHGLDELLARLTITQTISGGIHILYRCPDGIEGPLDLAKQADGEILIETRGQGSLVVCWPTPGYEILQGSMESIPSVTKEERDTLIGIARLFDERPSEPLQTNVTAKPRGETATSVEEFEASATWESILEPHGWRFMRHSRGLMRFVVRPGKDGKKGHSARVGVGTCGDRMWVWSTNSKLPANQLLTKFAVYTFLNHDGDFSAAALALGKEGYGPQTRGKPAPIQTETAPAKAGAFPNHSGTERHRATIEEASRKEKFYWFTDLGNATRFADTYGNVLRHCHDWERFLIWDGAKWEQDAPGNPGARVMAQEMVLEMSRSHDKDIRSAGQKAQDSGKLSAILREAKAFPSIGVRSMQLDEHDFLLGAPNGVIDLRTEQLLPSNPDLLITQTVSVPYDPEAKCPEFDRFIMAIMKDRKDLADLLLRFLGYSLTGSTEAQKFVLLYGERGRNGKGTLIGTMRRLLGPGLCCIIDKKLLTNSDSDSVRFARASLEGKRMVYANETGSGSKLDAEFIKEFTGTTDGTMTAERKGRDAYEFKLRSKLWYAVNSLPSVDWDGPYASRIIPIPFEQSFYNEDEDLYRPGDLKRDEGLERRLASELPGILATLVRFCVRWQKMGFNTPREVRALKEQYQIQTDNVGAWILECCIKSPLAKSLSRELFANYVEFCKHSRRGNPGKDSAFVKRLEQEIGVKRVRPGGVSWFWGIEIRQHTPEPEADSSNGQEQLF